MLVVGWWELEGSLVRGGKVVPVVGARWVRWAAVGRRKHDFTVGC